MFEPVKNSLESSKRGLLAILAIFILVFFDILFLGASIQPSNLSGIAWHPADYQQQAWLADFGKTHWGYRDVGSSYLQSEPARHFVARSWENGESIFWNPYSAAGTIGPEQLVDLKLSPISLLSVAFGATPASHDFSILFFMALGAIFLYLALRHFFNYSELACVTAAVIFLFNGFSISNLGSQNAQPYIFAPIFLFSLLAFLKYPGVVSACILIIAQAALSLITLLPVLICVFAFCYLLALAWQLEQHKSLVASLKQLGFLLLLGLASLMLVSPVYLPIISAVLEGDLLGKYADRRMLTIDYRGLLDIFSSHHFWQNYNAGPLPDNIKQLKIQRSHNTVAHLGLGAFLLIGSCLGSKYFWRPVSLVILLLWGYYLYMVLGLPGSAEFFQLPVIQSLNTQYISPFIMLGGCVLSAYCLTHFSKCFSWVSLFISAAGIFLLYVLVFKQIETPLLDFQKTNLLKLTFFAVFFIALLAVIKLQKNEKISQALTIGLVILLSVELIIQINTLRPKRYNLAEIDHKTLSFLKSNLEGQRMLSINRLKNLPPEWGSALGIRQIDMNTSTMLPQYEKLFLDNLSSDSPFFLVLEGGRHRNKRPVMEFPHPRQGEELVNDHFLDLLGVKYVSITQAKHVVNKQYLQEFDQYGYTLITGLPNAIYQNPDPAPFAWMVCDAKSGNKAPLDETGEFYRFAYVAPNQFNKLPPLIATTHCHDDSPVTLDNFSNTEITLSVDNKRPGILVTSETWHSGWKVQVNDQQKTLLRVNHAFRGVFLEKGQQQITFKYQAPGYTAGIKLMWMVLITMFGALAFSAFKFYKKPATAQA